MVRTSPIPTPSRLHRAGLFAIVALVQAGLFAAVGLDRAEVVRTTAPRPISVELFQPRPPVPDPPPVPSPSARPGGGAPAAPSRVRVPPVPAEVPPELTAPPVPAVTPERIIGVAPIATATPGAGQGGQGTGTGTGEGEGDGPGSGSGPLILRGASNGEILAFVPPEARRRRQAGRSTVSCLIRADTRLEGCRVVDEQPGGFGFGEAAIRIAERYFRFRPPMTASGRAVDGFRVTVTVNFGRQGG
ncbi:TonB family protein [Brevundimonas sp. R86498]|uniref:TonB family protein n=1 Tax=Brevundimonas sp. R86498 TaxID=3093845 RepID=UPI0037C5121B